MSQKAIVLLMVWISSFGMPIMLSATNVALPAITNHFSLSAGEITWVPMAYLMASAMFVLIFGKLSDSVGRKKVFLFGTVVMSLSSILAALSMSSYMLFTGRFLQGLGASMLYATQTAMISSAYPAKDRGKAIGVSLSAIYLGLALGPTVGGFVLDNFSWRHNFVLHIPLAIVVMILATSLVETDKDNESQINSFDAVGATLYVSSILLLCMGVSNLPGTNGFVLLGICLVAVSLFVIHSKKTAFPIWDIHIFLTNRVFSRSCLASFVMYTATFSNVVLLSLYLQELQRLSPTQAGLIMSIQPATMAILSSLTGRLSDFIEPRILATSGMLLTAASLFALSYLTSQDISIFLLASLGICGVGFSLFSSPNTNAIMGSVKKKDYGLASGTVATTRILGQLSSIFLIAFSMSFFVGDQQIMEQTIPSLRNAIELSFFIAGVLCIIGAFLSASRGKIHVSSPK